MLPFKSPSSKIKLNEEPLFRLHSWRLEEAEVVVQVPRL
jgi:hypothetical protein